LSKTFSRSSSRPISRRCPLRWVLHDWSDKYAVRILQNLVPVMKTGTRVLFFEYVLDEEPVTNATESFGLKLDKIMGLFNAKERTTKQWKEVMKKADERFVWKRTEQPAASSMSVIEAVWEG
jgi:hypothetical protein